MGKCILILLDGLGDRSYPEFNHKTPLQAARTPVLNSLAKKGANGLYHAALTGQALPSENAHFAMFGYDPDDFPGRGALEALGADIDLSPDDAAVLVHFAWIHEKNKILYLGDGFPAGTDEEASALIDSVGHYRSKGIDIRFHRTKGMFGVLILKGDVSRYITDSDPITNGLPLSDITPWRAYENHPPSVHAAHALKSYLVWVYRQLKNHPVNQARKNKKQPLLNGMVTQRAGQLIPVTGFEKKYGMRGISIASAIIYKGLSRFLGIDFMTVKDSKSPGRDMRTRLLKARDLLSDYDFIHVHTKAPDETAHTKNPTAKLKAIESLDRGIGKAIAPMLDDPNLVLIITADHSTPSAGPLVHSGEPVPLTICGPGVRQDNVRRYDEIHAAGGALGCVRGRELMYLILNYTDRAKLHGLMDTPDDQPFWPGPYQPFSV